MAFVRCRRCAEIVRVVNPYGMCMICETYDDIDQYYNEGISRDN